MIRFYLMPILLAVSCSSSGGEETIPFSEHTVEDAELLLSPETHPEIASPSFIKIIYDGFLLYDYSAQKILKYSSEGVFRFGFGREGEGPGEFQTVSNIWQFGDRFMIYDYRGARHLLFNSGGEFIEDIPVEEQGFSNALEAISLHQFYAPSNGEGGTLLRYIDTETGTTNTFGEAVAEAEETVDFSRAQQAISAGRVPAFMQNQVALSSNNTGVYSFQQTTGILQKYSHSGELEWEKDLKVPVTDGLFEQFLENNERAMAGGRMVMLFYAMHMEAFDGGVAVLLNTVEDNPVTMAWIPDDGGPGVLITYPEIGSKATAFSVDARNSVIYFINSLEGEVHKAAWPA